MRPVEVEPSDASRTVPEEPPDLVADGLLDHLLALRRYARALVGDPVEADDLVQECLTRALSRTHLFRRGTNLRAWLFTVMHNVHVNQVSRLSRQANHVTIVDAEPLLVHPPAQENRVALRQLAKAVRELPDEQRAVLLLVSLEGLKYGEVATILGIPIGTVMSRLSRARDAIRQKIAGIARLRRVK